MQDTLAGTARDVTSTLIRNEPVQARSAARLTALLDAAARTIDDIGFERLTTAMVAEGAGASIGTVYRYFPDRVAVLQSLAARNAERVGSAVLAAARDDANSDWEAVLGAIVEAYAEAFRTEPGFASLRLGDVIDLRPATAPPSNTVLANSIHAVLVERFALSDAASVADAVVASLEVIDALVARAFAGGTGSDEGILSSAKTASVAVLAAAL